MEHISDEKTRSSKMTTTKKDSNIVKTEEGKEEVHEINTLLRQTVRYKDTSVSLPAYDKILHLDLTGCNLSSLPETLPKYLPNIEIFFLSNNHFVEMPAFLFHELSQLQMIAFKNNRMRTIPGNCFVSGMKLKWLILTNNCITELPDTIQYCTQLQKCMLSGNCLTRIPSTISQCTNLELIRLACNQLSEAPMELLQLPKLKWIALGKNPFLNDDIGLARTSNFSHPTKLFENITIDESSKVLGRGASGVAYAIDIPTHELVAMTIDQNDATSNDATSTSTTTTVAVKTYHDDAITSDGTPELERRIALYVSQIQQQQEESTASSPSSTVFPLSANDNRGFTHVYGQCSTAGSLIMEYLHDYNTIADPPSFVSCTRDVYNNNSINDSDRKWSDMDMIYFITVMLNSLRLLHLHGITHGDLYGHNILVHYNDSGNNNCDNQLSKMNVKLSDFGAAFMYDIQLEYGTYIQLIEIRAFAVLLEEVTSHYYYLHSGNDGVDTDVSSTRNASVLFKNLLQQCSIAKTFDELYIYWKQIQLKQLAQEIHDSL